MGERDGRGGEGTGRKGGVAPPQLGSLDPPVAYGVINDE